MTRTIAVCLTQLTLLLLANVVVIEYFYTARFFVEFSYAFDFEYCIDVGEKALRCWAIIVIKNKVYCEVSNLSEMY